MPNNTEKVPNLPSETIEKKLLHEVSATASNSCRHGKNLPSRTAKQHGSEGQNGCHTTLKKCRTSLLKTIEKRLLHEFLLLLLTLVC